MVYDHKSSHMKTHVTLIPRAELADLVAGLGTREPRSNTLMAIRSSARLPPAQPNAAAAVE
jgi:hypothetical protein